MVHNISPDKFTKQDLIGSFDTEFLDTMIVISTIITIVTATNEMPVHLCLILVMQ